MKKFRNKAMAVAVALAMLFTCFAGMTVTSFAEGEAADAAFTVTTEYYQEGADIATAEPVKTVVTKTYTDAEFKALGADLENARYAYNKNGWRLFDVTHGVSIQNILDDNSIDISKLLNIELTDWYKGAAERYGKCTYLDLAQKDGYFFPNTKGTDEALNLEGGYTVPNAVIATTFGQTAPEGEATLGETPKADATEKYATATTSDYQMMIGGDEQGLIDGKAIGGYAFCSGVSGVIVSKYLDEDAFKVTVKTYKAGSDLTDENLIKETEKYYTDAEFKALGADLENARYAYNKNGWRLFDVTHGVSIQNILDDNSIDISKVQSIELTDWYKGAAEVYSKCTYLDLAQKDGYFFPNTKGTDEALNLEGGYTVPNAVIATTFGQTAPEGDATLGETAPAAAVEKYATATTSDYQMMVGGDEQGMIGEKAIGGYAFCSGVSGVIIKNAEKMTQKLTIKNVTKNVKLKKLKKTAQTVKKPLAVKGAQTTVTFKKVKVNKKSSKFTVDKKTGNIKVKKGTPKGTYKVTVKATAAANDQYNAASKNAVVTIKIK